MRNALMNLVAGFSMVVSSALAVAADKPAVPNPVTNGGFEELGAEGFPRDWVAVRNPGKGGAKIAVEVSQDAHWGKNAVRIKMEGEGAEAGINRSYAAGQGQGAMLDLKKGGVEFWYKAISCSGGKLTLNVIPMKADGLEGGGAHRAWFEIPESHVGDGKWHRIGIAYDFTASPDVKFVQIGPRVSRGSGEMVLDDFRWIEKVGPMLSLMKTWIAETKGKEGRELALSFSVKNTGDEVGEAKGTISVPDYLKAEPIADTAKIKPEDWQDLSWRVVGRRDKADVIRFAATTGDSIVESKVDLKPQLDPPTVSLSKFIVDEAEPFTFTCTVRNSGQANARDVAVLIALPDDVVSAGTGPLPAPISKPEALQKTVDVPAGGEASAAWRLRAARPGLLGDVRARVMFEDAFQEVRSVKLVAGGRLDFLRTDAVGNDRIRILFPKNSFGCGVGLIEVRDGLLWKRVGAIPRLARLVWQPAPGARSEQPIYADLPEVTTEQDKVSANFRRQMTDADGNQWTVNVRFIFPANGASVEVESSATCSRNVRLLCFEGPMVYAGEGAFGGGKTEAIFPGLEWLEGDEVSSSTLDITTPEHVRYVPHPNRVTIPCIGVLDRKTLVGILWDPKHKWDGVNDRMSAVFASPNSFEGTASHLMGLFVPSVPDWVKENEREASMPYDLKAGQPLTLKMRILTESNAKDALVAMDRWFEFYGIADPMPLPRRTLEDEIKFSMQTYFKPLWIPEEQKWWPYLGGPKLNYKPVVPSAFAHDLLTAAQVVKDPAAQKQYRDRFALVLPNLRHGGSDSLCFFLGAVEARHRELQARAMQTMQSQGPDGEWRFNANRRDQGIFKGRDYRELGPDGATELGTCAANARLLLRCARITGSEEALAAGLKALRFMERFRVPRAAQVWEVPVHTPDILAAAHAVVAYLDAYRLTGDKRWFGQARRWARAGLPFLYFWSDDKFSYMRYASIPVFGATWFKGNWMGRPVQWCGLDHAYALLYFSTFDDSLPWRKIAEGVTISGMYQQSTDEKDVGMWPDSIGAIDAKKSGWIFAPARITQNVYWELGHDPEPHTTLVGAPGGTVHITSPSRIEVTGDPKQGGTLNFTNDFAPPDPYYVLITPVVKPQQVLLDGKEIAFDAQLEKASESAARYVSSTGMLVIKVMKPGLSSISVSPVKRVETTLAARPVREIAFQFDQGDDEGWFASHDVELVGVANGLAAFKITGSDPYLVRSNLDVDAAKAKTLVIRMKASGGSGGQARLPSVGQVYWSTKESPAVAEDKDVRFDVKADGQFHEYRVNMAAHPLWTGTVTSLRLDPANGKEAAGGAVEIDYIKAE